jgi:hypothetical protein
LWVSSYLPLNYFLFFAGDFPWILNEQPYSVLNSHFICMIGRYIFPITLFKGVVLTLLGRSIMERNFIKLLHLIRPVCFSSYLIQCILNFTILKSDNLAYSIADYFSNPCRITATNKLTAIMPTIS